MLSDNYRMGEARVAQHDPALPDMTGSVTVITGAAGGIGAGIARRFAAAGAQVVIGHRGGRDAAVALAAEIGALAHPVEITDPDSCAALLAAADRFGRVDTLVNNAGIQPVQELSSLTVTDWRAVLDTNVTGTFAMTQAAAAVMGQRGGGSIIHIASIEGEAPAFGHAHYATAKAAVLMHMRAAALEYGPAGIRVNAVSPGLIDRPGLADAWPDGVGRYTAAAPLGRLGTAAEIGDACVFLASPMARWITGANLVVDGGVSVHPRW